jgi:2-phosphosulfolactate phosphatase
VSADSHDQHGFRARFEWGTAGVDALAADADVLVVVDVLSFSTSVSVAVDRGAAVMPYGVGDGTGEAHAQAHAAVLAGPRRGGPGPTLSPSSLRALGRGARIVLPSPNGGTCSLRATRSGAIVVAGCLRNATAVGRFAATRGGTTAVIAAGERWPSGELRPAVEDLIGAGAILAAMAPPAASPEAAAAIAAYRSAGGELLSTLEASSSGRELIDAGFAEDVRIAAELDASDVVPVLVDGAFVAG